MRDNLDALFARTWRGLLLVALGALGCVALANLAGNSALARAFGTLAWVAALAGAVSGLVSGGGLEERAER